jgi:hypothetical protein
MPSDLDIEIQQHIIRYLTSAETLAEFENWFAPVLWDIDDQEESTRERAGLIHILLAELSRGDRTIAEFQRGLTDAITVSGVNRFGVAGAVSIPESYGACNLNSVAA